ncbi:MAG: DUF4126 domain-containing protein [Verrucomicrobiota bacterium]
MEVLETLAVALGFATLAGLNLYLVVLVTGLAINQGWVDVSSTYPELMVLGDPAVVTAAGIFFCLEFFSDKVPWVDSLWDTIHTLVRPVGGALLAIHTLGPTEPAFEVIIALLAGGTTMLAHGFKSGTRLALNSTPEPVSNIAASVTEDLAVLGGLALMSVNPLLAAAFCLVFLGVSAWLTPKLFRRIRAFFWLLGHKGFSLFSKEAGHERLLHGGLTSGENQFLGKHFGGRKPEPVWSTRVLVGKSKGFPEFSNMTFGRLITEELDLGSVHFVGRKFWRYYHSILVLDGLEITHEPRFISQDIAFYDMAGKRKLVLRLPASHREIAAKIVENLIASRNRNITTLPSDRVMLASK